MSCLDHCVETPKCKYFTHYSADNVCITHEGCPQFDTTCQQCVAGQVECSDARCGITGEWQP